jgi:DNA-binding GntR family transcriptional regulator
MKARTSNTAKVTVDGVGRVIDYIDQQITDGVLGAGQRLIEAELCMKLGVGRSQVREALRILAGDRVVDLVPQRGARVRAISRDFMLEVLKVSHALIIAAMTDYVEQKNIAASIARLRRITAAARNPGSLRNALEFLIVIQDFLAEIVVGSGNSYLGETFRRIHWHHYNRALALLTPIDMLFESIGNFHAITEFLRKRDLQSAQKMLEEVRKPFFDAMQR